MTQSNKLSLRGILTSINSRYFCLAAALGLEFLLMAFRGYGFYFMENYMIVPTFLFLGMAFGKKLTPTARRMLFLSLGMVFWFFIAQTLHYLQGLKVRSIGLLTSVYLLAFLFAPFAGDGKKQWGLKLAAAACIGAALVLVLFTGLLALELLPGFLRPHVYWDGARLQAMWHPNICAIILMMGMAFCLSLFAESKRRWCKGLFLAGAVLFFCIMALTNSRTSILMASCIVAGFLFFCIWNGSWKRFIIGAVIAVTVILLLFTTAGSIFQAHKDALIHKYTQEALAAAAEKAAAEGASQANTPQNTSGSSSAEKPAYYVSSKTGKVVLITDAGQSSLSENMSTLNGRTGIWKTAFRYLREHPTVFLLGTDYSEAVFLANHSFGAAHAHNAWIETLMCLGLPGLLFALVFTGLAVCHIWVTFWGKTTLSQKTIAMLALVLMGAGILEPYLFFTDIFYHYTDFIFFLCLGYLIQWRSECRK